MRKVPYSPGWERCGAGAGCSAITYQSFDFVWQAVETAALFSEAAALRNAKGTRDAEDVEYQDHLEEVLHESQVRADLTQNVLTSFCNSQFPHKSVNLLHLSAKVKNWLTNFWGTGMRIASSTLGQVAVTKIPR